METNSRSCMENSMDRGTWQAIVHGGHKGSGMTEHTCRYIHTYIYTYISNLIKEHTHIYICVLVCVCVCVCVCSAAHSCLTLWDSMDYRLPDFSVHGIFPGRHTGMGCHFLLQGILPTWGLNQRLLHLLHWQVNSLPLHHLGSPVYKWYHMAFVFLFLTSLQLAILNLKFLPDDLHSLLTLWGQLFPNSRNWLSLLPGMLPWQPQSISQNPTAECLSSGRTSQKFSITYTKKLNSLRS